MKSSHRLNGDGTGAAEKRRLVTATLEPGASVSAIAREAGIHPGQSYGWRRELRAQPQIGFAPVQVSADPAPGGSAGAGAIDIEFATGARMRITGTVDAATAAAAVTALYAVIDAEATVVRRVYEYYTAAGLSIGAITRLLNEQGVPTRKRISRWERSVVVWAMLRNPAYKGAACFNKTKAQYDKIFLSRWYGVRSSNWRVHTSFKKNWNGDWPRHAMPVPSNDVKRIYGESWHVCERASNV